MSLLKKDVYNAKIKSIENEILYINNLVTKYLNLLTYLLLVLLLLLKIEYLVLVIQSRKTDYKTKINGIEKKITDHNHDKHITTLEVNKFMVEIFYLRLKRANVASKIDIANFVKRQILIIN